MTNHTLTLRRDDNRMGSRYGQHYYVEAVDGRMIKVEYLDWNAYDRDHAGIWGQSVAELYGATFVDQRPHACLYGFSAD